MDEKKRKRTSNMIQIGSMVAVVAAIAAMIWGGYTGRISGNTYKIGLCAALFVFWVLNDVVEPIVTKAFADRTPEQISAYRTYALLNLVGYAGLGYFAMDMSGSTGFYGAMVFAIAMMYKRRFLNRYLGIEEDAAQEDNAREDAAQEDAAQEDNAREDAAQEDAVLQNAGSASVEDGSFTALEDGASQVPEDGASQVPEDSASQVPEDGASRVPEAASDASADAAKE